MDIANTAKCTFLYIESMIWPDQQSSFFNEYAFIFLNSIYLFVQ